MTTYDPIIARLVEQLQQEIGSAPTFADAHAGAVQTIRRLEAALKQAISDRGCDLSLPNLGTNEMRINALRVRGRDLTRKLERHRRDHDQTTSALVLCEDGELAIAELRGDWRSPAIGFRPIMDHELHVEDLVGVVRALQEVLRRNGDLVDRVRWAQRFTQRVNDLFADEELVA